MGYMSEDSIVYKYPDWLRVGVYLRDRSSDADQKGYWVRSIESGGDAESTIVRVLRIGLGDTLKLTIPELLARMEPTGRNSSLPPLGS
jgi:hypothetical protein